jgi:hypothetical protein
LENQVGEQDHAAANGWGIQVGKLATQQIGDELQLQENRFNITDIIMPEIRSNERCREIYLLGI